jgi:hypothetical protein
MYVLIFFLKFDEISKKLEKNSKKIENFIRFKINILFSDNNE